MFNLIVQYVGFGLAVLCIPIVWQRVSGGSDRLSRAVRFILRMEDRVPSVTSLRALIDQSNHTSGIRNSLQEAGALRAVLNSIRVWGDVDFIIDPEFKRCLRNQGVPFYGIIASLIIEFGSHAWFLKPFVECDKYRISTRLGLFIIFSKVESTITLHSFERIENKIGDSEKWSDARYAYLRARYLPHRHVMKSDIRQLIDKRDLSIISDVCHDLTREVVAYVAVSLERKERESQRIQNLTRAMLSAFSKLNSVVERKRDSDEDILIAITSAEEIISLGHKIIFGPSTTEEIYLCDDNAIHEIGMIWSKSSLRLTSLATKPEFLEIIT